MDEIKLSLDENASFQTDVDDFRLTQKGLASRSLAEEFVAWIPVEGEAYKVYGPKPQASTYKSWPRKEDTSKVAFKDHSKPWVEEKGKLIINPTRCFKCNDVGHNAINCPTKRTLVFIEDLNGWIEKSDDDFQEGIVGKDESSEDQDITSFEADEEGMSLLTIRGLPTQIHEQESSLQKANIFHNKYLVGGKGANLFIDSGSCTDVASTYLVEKLNLHLFKHPKPYELH
ncbi:hypothetical protein M9H77_03216 [Catharanthus roseus]|uniref:Uncharacterized protein n=1 Tax=Catharanthus roseus TaxID=4058 RepID=A0ACC0CB35_CATRO|nr:hypothetical protein M9H77_03216 [Catharanthus roseus]